MSRATAILHGGDAPLRSLLADVLRECGVFVEGTGTPQPPSLLVIAVTGELGLRRLRTLVTSHPHHPVLAVLPFEDETLGEHALRLGASGLYALGTPLEHLRVAVRSLTERTR